MSKSVFFSIVTAVHNGEKFLAEMIESILDQSFREFELIIVNDKSTDRSTDIVKQYMERDKRIRLIHNSSDSGPSQARNYGVLQAIGDWIAICDADDLWLPEKLRAQANFISTWQHDKPIVALGTSGYTINEASKILSEFKASPSTLEEFYAFKISGEPFIGFLHSSMIFRKDLFDKIGGYRADYVGAEDADLFTRLIDLGITLNIRQPLALYRKHLGSWQLDNTLKQANNVERIKENTYRRRNGMNELTYEEFVNQMQQQMTIPETKAYLRKHKGKFLYRVGAINLANGRYILGIVNLLRALLYDKPLIIYSLRNIFWFKAISILDSFKNTFKI